MVDNKVRFACKIKKDQKAAAQFRRNLEKDGFVMHQYSVYMRYCGSLESVAVHIKRVRAFSPHSGHISVLSITDKQYSNIVNIWGEVEKKFGQLHFNWNFFSNFAANKHLIISLFVTIFFPK